MCSFEIWGRNLMFIFCGYSLRILSIFFLNMPRCIYLTIFPLSIFGHHIILRFSFYLFNTFLKTLVLKNSSRSPSRQYLSPASRLVIWFRNIQIHSIAGTKFSISFDRPSPRYIKIPKAMQKEQLVTIEAVKGM